MTTLLQALLLSDERPGHFNLSDGIIAAAQTLRPVEVTRIAVRRGRWPGAAVAAWSNSGLGSARLLQSVYGLDAARLPKADLVVSAGGETLAANVACARLLGAANIFYGSLRRFRSESFNLVLTSYPRLAMRPRHALALKSSPAASLAWSRRPATRNSPPKTLGLLIGGPSGETSYTAADWDRLLALVESAGALGVKWRISNSRRTPARVGDELLAMASRSNSPIELFVDVRQPAATSLLAVLGSVDAAVVTDDSSSMVSDAVTAGLPTVGVIPTAQALTADEQDYRGHLTAAGWYRPLPLAGLTAETLCAEIGRLSPRTEDPCTAVAALLAQRLPKLFAIASV